MKAFARNLWKGVILRSSNTQFMMSRSYTSVVRQMRSSVMFASYNARYFSSQQMQDQYEADPYETILQQSAQDLAQINERIRLYFKKGEKDYDEFDNILLQLSMQVMNVGDLSILE